MDKSLLKTLASFILFVLAFTASAQNEYLTGNPKWFAGSSCNWGGCIDNDSYIYYISGDTIINSLVYKKLEKQGTGYRWYMNPGPPDPSCSPPTYAFQYRAGYVRSAGKQMFYTPHSNPIGPDQLLYDFNLAVGDSLPLSFTNCAPDVVVDSIDSILVGNEYRDRFYISGSTWSEQLVEGIGHSSGFIEPLCVTFECGYGSLCYSRNDTTYYVSDTTTVCDFTVAIKELDTPAAYCYPNPATDEVSIVLTGKAEMTYYTIRNQFGRTVSIGKASGSTVNISLNGFARGVYFAEIRLENGLSCYTKIVKQ